jgi:transposase
MDLQLKDARTLPPEQLLERRKQAILLHKKGETRIGIAKVVGVNRNVVGQWISKWKEGGTKALKVGRPGAPKGSGQKLDAEQQKKVRLCLVEAMPDQLKLPFALWTRAAVQQLIRDLFGIRMPIRTVGHYLKQWGYTPQKPVKRAYERNDRKVSHWLETQYPELARRAKTEGGEIHWGDETGISTADQVGRGYAPKGKTPVRRHKGKPERINMISTVTNQGKVRFMFYKDTMNAQRLIAFLRRLVKDSGRKVFLILDNLRVHHSKLVKKWLEGRENEIEIHYLPSYSPDLNPDEYLNCDLKNEMGKRPEKNYPGKLEETARAHMKRLQRLPSRVASYFRATPIRYAA